MSRRIASLGIFQLSLLAVSLGLAPAALAEDPPFSDLPPYLLERLTRGGALEDFLKTLTQEMQRADLDDNGLDRQDMEIAQQIQAAQYRATMMQQIVSYDLDGNGELGKDEAARAVAYQMGRRTGESDADAVRKQVAAMTGRIMMLDGNGDGIVTLAESMKAARPEEQQDRRFARTESLLALDPNKDGRLTAAELDEAARTAFGAVDYDHDGTISSSEAKLLAPARQFQQQMQQAMPCDLPKPGAEDELAVLGIYDGVLQPNVTVAGQDETTQLTLIDIEPGDRPLYLVLTSYTAMIWQFRGATDRLARAVVVRGYISGQQPDLAGAGVIGLGADKVTFLPRGSCGKSFNKADSKEAQLMSRIIARVTGRVPDAMRGIYSAKTIAMPSGAASAKEGDKDLIIPGDGNDVVVLGKNTGGVRIIQGENGLPLAAHEDWLAKESNLATVDPTKVVAPGTVETYEILPHQYGLRQLVREGKLERTESGYRILQPIARFPTGLAGAHGVKFILPEGVPMPGGDAGHSQIILEKKPAQ
jgi:hypothetical protein